MLRSSLKRLGGDSGALLAAAGIDPTARAEDIDIAGFCALARAYREAAGPNADNTNRLARGRGVV